jgi:hypothetical protein
MIRLGTHYGGWFLPEQIPLDANSFVVSAGVGEDISFDLTLQARTGCKILLLDPTERAIRHVAEMKEYYAGERRGNTPFSGSIQPDYMKWVEGSRADWGRIEFRAIGLWTEPSTLKFYKQDNPLYVSQSFVPGMYSNTAFTLAPVDRLSNIVPVDQTIDLLKLDIEGAEMPVLDALLVDAAQGRGCLPRWLCVEFDALLKGMDPRGEQTQKLVGRLQAAGYVARHESNWNVVFSRAAA